jgi:hypothetical protein
MLPGWVAIGQILQAVVHGLPSFHSCPPSFGRRCELHFVSLRLVLVRPGGIASLTGETRCGCSLPTTS